MSYVVADPVAGRDSYIVAVPASDICILHKVKT